MDTQTRISSSSNSIVVAMVLASIFALVLSKTLRSDIEALRGLRRSTDPNVIPRRRTSVHGISRWIRAIVPAQNSLGFCVRTPKTT
ncbi:hypothetical protein V6N12_018717 [Hibiscus sabdariffa]|uniref:Uncharacterized protein n=1 Tax=Hibiscus sabdariffa TaxID=183260 RepID=A0ABR2A6W6_9ROSI